MQIANLFKMFKIDFAGERPQPYFSVFAILRIIGYLPCTCTVAKRSKQGAVGHRSAISSRMFHLDGFIPSALYTIVVFSIRLNIVSGLR